MFDYLRRLAASLLRRNIPFHPFNPPGDPLLVREPQPTRPGGRSSAIALEDPPPPTSVRAVGKKRIAAVLLVCGLSATPAAAQTPPPAEKPFVSGGRIEIQLSGGEYQIRAAADNRIRVTLTRNPGSTKVDIGVTGSQATVRLSNAPRSNFSATIDVPKSADLTVHLTGGDITIAGITGNKDVDSYAGNVAIIVPNPNEYGNVEASVKAGDINAAPFGGSKSGLLQTFTWSGKGKYTLRAKLGAGNLELRDK